MARIVVKKRVRKNQKNSKGEAKQDMIEELKHKMRTASPKEKEKIAMWIETLEEC